MRVALTAAGLIVLLVALVLSGESNTQDMSQITGMVTVKYGSPGVRIYPPRDVRPTPAGFSTKYIDWNDATMDELFTAVLERTEISRSQGGFTEKQAEAMTEALLIMRLGLQENCVSVGEVKTALRVLGGANNPENFRAVYEKSRVCVRKAQLFREAQSPRVQEPRPPPPPEFRTVYEGEWTVFSEGAPVGGLRVDGKFAQVNIMNSLEFAGELHVEVVEGGVNLHSGVARLVLQGRERLRGTLYVAGRMMPVEVVRG